jgi:AhpD family alkylhydroperoxidase
MLWFGGHKNDALEKGRTMEEKIREMIAIGACVTANCIPCIRYHFAKARELGVSDAEIKAAVQVGKLVRKGAARKWDEEIDALLSVSSAEQKPGCGCA